MKVKELKEFVPVKIELVFETKEEFMLFHKNIGDTVSSELNGKIYDLLQEIRKERNL